MTILAAFAGCAVAQYGGHGYGGFAEPGYGHSIGYAGHGHGHAYAAPVVKAALPVVAKTVDYDVRRISYL